MSRPIITLLTDFGTSDHYVAVMKGVMLMICPDARLMDITHEVQPYAIGDAAFTLSQAWPYFPKGSVHLIVVDPGVGSARRPIVAEAGGHLFVAPDNGVLTMVVASADSGFRAREITAGIFFRKPVSRTFHGRDIFSPVAAHLATGMPIERFGPEICDPVLLPILKPVETSPRCWMGVVLHVDRFGNLVTNFGVEDFGFLAHTRFQITSNGATIQRYRNEYTSASPGEVFLIPGSSGRLEISANQAHAAELLGLASGSYVHLRCETQF